MFDPVDPNQSLPDLELGILKYWREEDTFKRSLKHREKNEVFSFYDGPPFATGLPHYGHLLAGTIKDVIPRYQTMRGKYVRRRFGWDCHGLPVENEIEKEKKLSSKKDIEALGIANFNALCRGAVQRYAKEWRTTVERMGRWVDMDHDYRTMDPDYMESIWWVFKQLYDRKLIYEGHKPMHVCPRCQTPLSNFEVTQGYKDIQDFSITAMFELTETRDERHETREEKSKPSRLKSHVSSLAKGKTYALAWTTTGWTLPGNMFLAVHPDVDYVTVDADGAKYIVAKDLAESVFKGKEFKIVDECKGKKLLGKTYKPLFPYYEEKYTEKAFRIVEGDFVTTTDGTGIVHIATGYGEDDFMVGQREKVGVVQHVDIDGTFKKEIKDFAGKSAKPKDDHQSGDKMIAKWLKDKGKLFKAESFMHTYPHCWRCDSPLLNYATSSWFVAVEKIKDKMVAANKKTTWVPDHLRDGRFGKWLEGARDWAISRNRFWGTPLPIWRNTMTGDIEVIGSRDELMKNSKQRFTKIYVARHAESQGNVDRIYQGKEPGTDLTARGAKMAEDLGQKVLGGSKELPVVAIYCSPLQRTRQTAAAIAAATGAPITVDPRLKEVEFGEYEGKHIDFDDLTFVRERRAHKLETGQIESVYHFQGMETWNSTQLRMSDFFKDVLEKHKGQSIAIVTHADLVMNAVHFFTGEDPHKIVHQPYPELASLRTFYWDHETKSQMDLHKETVDELVWKNSSKHAVELTLVRHGETDFNKQGIVQGSNIDMVLNKVGKEQAKKTGQELKTKKFDVIVTSDLKRAKETAKIIAKELGMKIDAESELLRERNTGDWSGKSADDVRAENKLKAKWGIAFAKATPPNGESFDQFVARARRAHDWLLKEYPGKKVLVVAHGGFLKAMLYITQQKTYMEATEYEPKNAAAVEMTIAPQMRRIEEVLDCWFESGSMPYAQEHYPFEGQGAVPPHFPADFIAEGLDQTRGWFYTLMVLSSALYDCPAFKNCVVNGTVLAEDGKKMSKRLKNYPEPTEIVKKYGADAVRFALMSSPAVRAEDLRFSEKFVSESVRSVLLPLWNAYRLFVTYANAADWKPSLDFALKNAKSPHLLDRWIVCKTQELVNKMTKELEGYDLSATCAELAASIDDLTNWYVRLSRRRLAGKEEGTNDAFDTLYRVIVTNCQLLAPFCPFITEAIYMNLVGEDHDSIHFTEWPKTSELTAEDKKVLSLMDNTRTVVTLGLSLRSGAKIRVRQPLSTVTFALPPSDTVGVLTDLIEEELNVKKVNKTSDAHSLASAIVQVDARKVGPRLGKKVQDVIKAGKAGSYEEKDGKIVILGEEFSAEEAKIVYQSKEGQTVAADHGIVVSLDTTVTDELVLEAQARELIHAIQQLRKDAGLEFTDTITLSLSGAEKIMEVHRELILEETRAVLGDASGDSQTVDLGGADVGIRFKKN
jgi:isoleucyl-tRNA synthetase